MKAKKHILFVLAAAAALVTAGPIRAAAAEAENKSVIYAKSITQEEDGLGDLPGNDELFEGYVEELFFGKSMAAAYGSHAESRLEGAALQLYQRLKESIEKVAAGELASTEFSFTLSDIGITKESWTAADLGVDAIVENGRISQEAIAAWERQNIPGLNKILGHLLADCPLDLYWYDKTSGTGIGPDFTAYGSGENCKLRVDEVIGYFPVALEYQDASAQTPSFTVNQSLALSAQTAAGRAKEIVKKYEGFSDHDKLDGYRKEICSMVSYNYDAAEDDSMSYGNPWQIIWVFDGDDTTDVVCEGYAKAFQYLCDLSDFFSPNIKCYTISGTMDGGTGAGAHMWNIVTMDDKKNYIVDITNCDEESIGADDLLFLAGADGSMLDGYVVNIAGYLVTYEYSGSGSGADMFDMYGDVLQISASDYEFPYKYSGGFGSDLEWTLDANGILNIKGSGNMPEPENQVDYEAIPWYSYRNEIKRVVIEEGITSVASWAFLQITNITEIYLPQGLKSIENASFALSGIKKLELPETLETIGMLAFANCTDLAEMEIPDSVKNIGIGAFMDCGSLDSVTIDPANPYFAFEDGILYNKEKTAVHLCLGGKKGEVVIADGVTEIGIYAFNGCRNIENIVVPESVTKIGIEAFKECDLLKDVWFLGECPVFEEGTEGEGTVFAGNDLTIHYPKSCEASWTETATEGFADAQISFKSVCRDSEHQWQEDYTIDQEATCTENGKKSKSCEICGKVKERLVIPAGHSWEETYTVEKEATCIEEGLEAMHCKNCEEIKDRKEIPFAAHQLTKAKKGTVEYYICSVCSKTFQDAQGMKEISVADIKDQPEKNEIKAARISITSDASNKIAAGKKVLLKASVFPENVTNSTVEWESDNTKYATVNAKGVVTTKKAGKGKSVTITATATDGSGIKASFKIKLMENAVTKVKIINAKKTLKAGKTMKLKVSVSKNGNKVNKKVLWTSSNTDYATVDSKGKVTAKKNIKGKAVTITVMSADGTKKKHKVKIKIV